MHYKRYLDGTKKIISTREDLSDYLFHFTKGPDAFNTLCEILRSGEIKDIKKRGFLCFTETPLSMLRPMFEYYTHNFPDNPQLAPYGIGINKNLFFQKGGRPVIYGAKDEKKLLDSSIHWRFVETNLPIPDFSWLREWRIKRSKISFSNKGVIVITNTESEQDILGHELKNYSPYNYPDKEGIFLDIRRVYLGVSMEKIKEFNTKQDLQDLLTLQLEDIE